MPRLSASAIAAYALEAGFTGNDARIAVAVALAESDGQTDAVSPKNSNGTYDYGVWQINTIHNPTAQNWKDPLVNAKMAKRIFDEAKGRGQDGWSPWSTYKNGRYRTYMMAATTAVQNPDKAPTRNPANDLPAETPSFVDMISSGETWFRVGYFVGGLVCLSILAVRFMPTSQLSKGVVSIAKGMGK